jgi:hypothetical protein
MGGLGFLIDPVTNDGHGARQQCGCGDPPAQRYCPCVLGFPFHNAITAIPPKDTKFNSLYELGLIEIF